jgi:hypothetical protein
VGLATSGAQLLRASAVLNTDGSGTCGSYSAFQLIVGGTDPGSPVVDTVSADHTCYRYEYIVPDSLGLKTTYTSPDIKVDTTAPGAPTFIFSALSNSYWSGGVLYYRPAATSGAFTLAAHSTDPYAGIASYTLPIFPAGWASTSDGLGSTTYSYGAANASIPSASQSATATNNAGTRSVAASFNVLPDGSAPSGGGVLATGLFSSITVSLSQGSDAGAGLNSAAGLLQRASAPYLLVCGSFGSFATIATNPASPYTDSGVSAGTCYEYRYIASDNVGNQATYTSNVVVRL